MVAGQQQEKIQQIKNILISRRSSVQNYINTLPEQRSEQFVKRLNTFIEVYDNDAVIDPFYIRTGIIPTIRPPAEITDEPITESIVVQDTKWAPTIVDTPS